MSHANLAPDKQNWPAEPTELRTVFSTPVKNDKKRLSSVASKNSSREAGSVSAPEQTIAAMIAQQPLKDKDNMRFYAPPPAGLTPWQRLWLDATLELHYQT